jgi:hypothetical protein
MLAPSTRARASTVRARRRHSRVLGCALAAVVSALAAAGCGSSGSGPGSSARSHDANTASALAPSCLPATLDHSAKLAGVDVDVSPAPGTDTADPHTQISFLGAAAAAIHDVSVVGQRSGQHRGRLLSYSQGDGASFVPETPFTPGEQVVVHAVIGTAGGGTRVVFSFGVDTPFSTAGQGQYANPQAAPSDYQTFETLPGVQAPILTVTDPDHDRSAGDIFTTNGPGTGRYGALIYSPQGQLVWFDQLSGGVAAENLNVQSYEGQRDLTFWQGTVLVLGFGQGEDIVMNSHYRTVATIKGGNGLEADLHEFQIAPHDVAYITAYNPIRCNLSSQGGPRNGVILDPVIEEIDMKTGLVRWEWHSLDHVGVSESETSPPNRSAWDWFHLNSIDPEPNGDIFISARNTWAAYQIQDGTGQILWRLGGLKSSFKMGPGTQTAWQHDGRILPDGEVTLFDDGSNPPEHYQSRAVRIALDFKTHQARLVSAYKHPNPPLLAASQGNMQTLPNGNTLVGYGGVPEISEYAADGTLLFDAHLSYDLTFYRAYRFPWTGRPLSPPIATANLNNTNEETIVHMSWNGATGVAAWRVLAGKSPASLAARATIQTAGFESSTVLPKTYGDAARKQYGYVAVQALDSAGHVLGTSNTEPVKSYDALLPAARRSA